MRKLGILIATLMMTFSAALLLSQTAEAATITAPTSITSNTTWTSDNVYVVPSTTTIQSGVQLIVNPGTVVKFQTTSSKMVVKGTLNATGTDASNIVFTSYKDDAYGGDTNGDGSATTPATGNWNYLESYTGGTINMSYCRVRYGAYMTNTSLVYSSGGDINLSNSILEYSKYRGVELKGSGSITNNQVNNFATVGIYVNSGSPTISNNTIAGGTYGIYLLAGTPTINSNTISNSTTAGIYQADGSSTISGNTLDGGSGSGIGIVVPKGTASIQNNTISQFPSYEALKLGSEGNSVTASVSGNTVGTCKYPLGLYGDRMPSLTLDSNDFSGCSLYGIYLNVNLASDTITAYDIPYIVKQLHVKTGAAVQINPGVIFKMDGSTVSTIYGTLNAIGDENSKIIFTSLKDDNFGGDTNNDGTTTTPAPGDWGYISTSDNSVINSEYVNYVYGSYSLFIYKNAEASISNCEISQMSSYGIYISGGNNVTQITNNRIHNNSQGIRFVSGASPVIINNEIYENNRGLFTNGGSSANIALNNIHNNNTGIDVWLSSSDIFNSKIECNNIVGNLDYGFNTTNNGSTIINAENNWWGSASGPYPHGTGDKISSVTKIDADPWFSSLCTPSLAEKYYGYPCGQGIGGDPINLVTGNYTYNKTDIEIPTRGIPLKFSRFYNVLDNEIKPLGRGWQHNYNCSVNIGTDGSATVLYPDGHKDKFPYSNGSFVRPMACCETLTSTASGYLLTFKDQSVFEFNSNGQLIAVRDKNGNANTLTYNGNLLQSVTEPGGRSLTFQYDTSSRLTQVTDPGNRTLGFGYDGNSNLLSCTDVNGGVWEYGYTDNRLTSIIDPEDNNTVTNTYDTEGRVLTQTDGENNTTTFTYDTDTRTNTMTDAMNNTVSIYYDYLKRISSISYPGNIREEYGYDINNNKTSVTDKNGNTTLLTYDTSGNLLTRNDPAPLNYVTSLTYNSQNNPTRIVDPANFATDYTYDTCGNLLTISRAVSAGTATNTMTYNQYGQVETITDPDGNTTEFDYDNYGNLTVVTDAMGYITTYTYDILGRQLTKVDPRGNVTGGNPADYRWTYTYNALDKVLTATDPLGGVIVNTYDLSGNLTSSTDPRDNTTSYTYNGNNKLVSSTDPLNRTTTYDYDANGNLASVTDANDHTTTYDYNSLNQLTSITDALNHTESYTLDGNGNRTAVTDRNGHTTTYTYDVLNRHTQITDALDGTTVIAYDSLGNKTSVTDPRGKVTTMNYDQGCRILTVTDDDSNTTTYTYDLAGNRLTMTDARNATWTYEYDDYNRLTGITDPLTHTVQIEYDEAGNVVGQTDENDVSNSFAYNSLNKLVSVTDALNHTTNYEYDENGNLVSVQDANSHESTFAYDPLNRLLNETDPLNHTYSRTYDLVGNISSITRPDSETIDYTYDANNRLTEIEYPDQTSVAFTYDNVGNRLSMTDPTGSTSYDYNELNHLTSFSKGTDTVGYGYDAAGNVTGITYPNSLQVSYTYNDLNQVAAVSDGTNSSSITYDEAGNRTQEVLPNGITVNYTYDQIGRLTSVEHLNGGTALARATYTLDNVGNRLTVTDEQNRTTSYDYDDLYQLTQVVYPNNQTVNYTYDPVGNRTGAGGVTYTYDDADRLTDVGGVTYTHDVNGNLTSVGGTTQYQYDYENRLISYSKGTDQIQYTYDGNGNRVRQAITGSTNETFDYVYDINTQVPRLLVEKDNAANTYNYLYAGRLFSRIDPGAQIYYHQDGLGSISVVSDVNGQQLNRYEYDAFGDTRSITETVRSPFRFTGEQYDSNGLGYLRARYYNPGTGRLLSRDSYTGKTKIPLSLNRYTYCRNNPINYVDPTGHDAYSKTGMDAYNSNELNNYDSIAIFANTSEEAEYNVNYKPAQSGDIDDVQTTLAVVGLIFDPADGVNALIYLARGRYEDAAWSAGSIVPIAGVSVTMAKWGGKGVDIVNGGRKADIARQLGKEGEDAAGIINAKERIPSLSGTAKYRIPDELLQDEKILREIKNVSSQSYTNQLRDFNAWANQNGYQFILEVRPGAKLSGPLQEAINNGDIVLKNIGQ